MNKAFGDIRWGFGSFEFFGQVVGFEIWLGGSDYRRKVGPSLTGGGTQVMNKASCLSLLSNAILVWNTVHISNIVSDLRENGHAVPDEHLAVISPMLQKHVIVNGMYDFTRWQHKPMQVQ